MASIVKIDDAAIVACLDEMWRSPGQIQNRLSVRNRSIRLAKALERLADMDQIDRKLRATDVQKRDGSNLIIRLYRRRRLQR